MLDYEQLRPGAGFRPLRSALYYSQRLVTHAGLRRSASRTIAAAVNLCHRRNVAGGAWQGDPGRTAPFVRELDRDGYAVLDIGIEPSAVAEMRAFLDGREVVIASGDRVRVDRVPVGTTMAAYPLPTVLNCPSVLEFINSSLVLDIVAEYLGCKPTLSSIGIRWSFPNANGEADIQAFHRDPDDWRFLKLFVYLTDVDAATGPHVYVAGSHRVNGRLSARPYAAAEVEHRFGRDNLRTVVGPAGTAFLCDTYGIHRGAPPTVGPRLILQAQYSLLPIFAFRYRPVKIATGVRLDPYINRLMVA